LQAVLSRGIVEKEDAESLYRYESRALID
jgi:hypothetical protein